MEIKESCGGSQGHWYCPAHDEHLQNNLMAAHHESTYPQCAEQKLVWWCADHDGPEQP